MANAIHGRSGAAEIGSSPSLIGSLTAWAIKKTTDDTESTAMGDAGKTYLGGLIDCTVDIEVWFYPSDAGQTKIEAAMAAGTPEALKIYPAGKVDTKPMYSGNVTILSVEASGSKDGLVGYKASGRGLMTLGVYDATP